jgi:hypothetical protein
LLKRIVANNSFDYSVAQATSEWIAEAIQGCSLDFASLADSIQGLKDAVALSCGLGITEIWSTLLIQTPPSSTDDEQKTPNELGKQVDVIYLFSYAVRC